MDHTPYIRHIPHSPKAVLMVHGIAGSPVQFRGLLPVIPADWSVYNILLDGHGGTVEDFSHSSMTKWRSQVEAQLQALLEEHRQVLIVAHSMGTLFAIQAAIRFPHRIPALFLLQVPLKPHMPPRTCISVLQAALGIIKPGSRAEAVRNATAMALSPCLWKYLGWIPRFLELFREIATTRKLLSQLQVPTKSFPSAHDELVSIRSCKYLTDHPYIQNILLPHSGHFSYAPEDLALMQTQLQQTIQTIEKQPPA